MTTSAIKNMQHLSAAVAGLPPVAPGCIRVWRGQTHDYPQFLPSGLRQSLRKQIVWKTYCQHLHSELLPSAVGPDGEVAISFLMASALWIEALAQHYGPGSDYLDVSHSMECALWFALNKYREEPVEGLIGPEGPPDSLKDHATLTVMASYDPWTEAAFLYAFDLPLWDGQGVPTAGEVVDLALAPAPFSDCPRMQVQRGCLVMCRDRAGKAYDMRTKLVPGTPLLVQRPLTGLASIDWPVADVFPSPEQDHWYAMLLSVPMNYTPEPAPPRLQRQIPVVPYRDPHNDEYTQSIVWREVAHGVPLVHRALPLFVGQADPARRPTAIVLEAPTMFPHPTADSGQWHHRVLATGLPDDCPWYAPGGDQAGGRVSLLRVLFEFSQLEHTGWERVIEGKHRIENALRALFFDRTGTHWTVNFIRQTIPGGSLAVKETLALQFDAASARWVFFAPQDPDNRVPLDQAGALAKPVLMALLLLRQLDPRCKLAPMPRMSRFADGLHHSLLSAGPGAARLVRVASPVCDWFVLRDRRAPSEPFTHDKLPAMVFDVDHEGAFADAALPQHPDVLSPASPR